jgi:hypothetical protein
MLSFLTSHQEREIDSALLLLTSNFAHIQVIHKRMVQFQKLLKHLFITLHGHNIHCKHRELSQCLMR